MASNLDILTEDPRDDGHTLVKPGGIVFEDVTGIENLRDSLRQHSMNFIDARSSLVAGLSWSPRNIASSSSWHLEQW